MKHPRWVVYYQRAGEDELHEQIRRWTLWGAAWHVRRFVRADGLQGRWFIGRADDA